MAHKKTKEKDYLHPALLSLRAYILPMSPMPMRPMTNPSIPGGTWDGGDCGVPILLCVRSDKILGFARESAGCCCCKRGCLVETEIHIMQQTEAALFVRTAQEAVRPAPSSPVRAVGRNEG